MFVLARGIVGITEQSATYSPLDPVHLALVVDHGRVVA